MFESVNKRSVSIILCWFVFPLGQVCLADTMSDITIPLAVGCAMAGLVIVILIAYCFGRRRVGLSYEAM